MANIPPLPKIYGDVELTLDVFMHRNLKAPQAINDQYGETDRLAVLGAKAVELAVTYHLFSRRPHLNVQDIETQRKKYIGEDAYENIKSWLDLYGLRQKYRVAPSQTHLLDDPEEMTRYFHTFVGAIYWKQGLAPVQAWISGLLSSDEVMKLEVSGSFPPQRSFDTYPGHPGTVTVPPPLFPPLPPSSDSRRPDRTKHYAPWYIPTFNNKRLKPS